MLIGWIVSTPWLILFISPFHIAPLHVLSSCCLYHADVRVTPVRLAPITPAFDWSVASHADSLNAILFPWGGLT